MSLIRKVLDQACGGSGVGNTWPNLGPSEKSTSSKEVLFFWIAVLAIPLAALLFCLYLHFL